MSVSTKPPAGMRDFLPDDLERRELVLERIRQVYRRHGFRAIETPTLERIDILTGKYGEEGDQLMYKVLKRGDKLRGALAGASPSPAELADLGMRYDLTVPLCRVVAQYQNRLPRILKVFQLRPVWRADRPAKGRFREFYQCDVDVLGTTSVVAEVEALAAAAAALSSLGFADYAIRLNDRRLLTAIATSAGIAEPRHTATLVALDKRDKIGEERVRAELEGRGISPDQTDRLFALLAAGDGLDEPRAALSAVASQLEGEGVATGAPAVARLDELFELLEQSEVAAGRLRFDPSLARGLSYYTGPIFEIDLPGFSGSVGGGGRYDDLVGMFLGRPVPACGLSLGVERLLMIMEDRGMFPDSLAQRGVFVTRFRDVSPAAGLRLAQGLRAAGIEADVFPEALAMKKQFKLAERSGARVVAVIGPDEAAEGLVSLKNMASGEQVRSTMDEAVDQVRAWLG